MLINDVKFFIFDFLLILCTQDYLTSLSIFVCNNVDLCVDFSLSKCCYLRSPFVSLLLSRSAGGCFRCVPRLESFNFMYWMLLLRDSKVVFCGLDFCWLESSRSRPPPPTSNT